MKSALTTEDVCPLLFCKFVTDKHVVDAVTAHAKRERMSAHIG